MPLRILLAAADLHGVITSWAYRVLTWAEPELIVPDRSEYDSSLDIGLRLSIDVNK